MPSQASIVKVPNVTGDTEKERSQQLSLAQWKCQHQLTSQQRLHRSRQLVVRRYCQTQGQILTVIWSCEMNEQENDDVWILFDTGSAVTVCPSSEKTLAQKLTPLDRNAGQQLELQ